MGSFYFLFPVLTDKTKDYLCIFATEISEKGMKSGNSQRGIQFYTDYQIP